jgi:hypothetical protein
MARTLRIRDLFLGLALATGLAAAPPLLGGGGGLNGGSVDRGDNPVVGSLPCMVDPQLLDLFWVPFNRTKPGDYLLRSAPPVLGVIGSSELEYELLDAYGANYGFVDAEHEWACLGLVDQGTVVLDRWLVAGGMTQLWQFLPPGYVGGNLRVAGPNGQVDKPILSNDTPIALANYAAMPEVSAIVELTFSPPRHSSLAVRKVRISMQGGLLLIDYRP